MLRRGLKLTALAAVVVLALTGFSTGHGHGGSGKSRSRGSSSSSSGGGCSSSKQNHGSSYNGSHYNDNDDDDYYDDDSYGSSGGSDTTPTDTATGSATGDADVVIVDCAGPGRKAGKRRPAGKADSTVTVRVTSQALGTNDFSVGVDLLDGGGRLVENVSKNVSLDEGETETVTLRMTMPRQAANVYRCANPWATTV
ncbi:hypothetical protein [Streptomyces sp. NPDC048527]|uniref:hypothetical protein n=1 Tax=Streptomyces sp. NPDC048527 TaxID=3365568 RepID=UPI0037206B86